MLRKSFFLWKAPSFFISDMGSDIVNPVLGAGLLGAGCWVLGAGCSVLGAG